MNQQLNYIRETIRNRFNPLSRMPKSGTADEKNRYRSTQRILERLARYARMERLAKGNAVMNEAAARRREARRAAV